MWKEKNEAWETVALSFNARTSTLVQRDSMNLKAKYEAIKKSLKKKVAQEKCNLYVTGGGPKITIMYKDWEEKLLAILKLAICGLSSIHDCDDLPQSLAATVMPVSSVQQITDAGVLPVFVVSLPSACEDIEGSNLLIQENPKVVEDSEMQIVSEVSIASGSSVKDTEETLLPINSTTKKWDTWTPTSLRSRKSLVLRKQPRRELSKKEILNGKYDALADERQKLIAFQLTVAKKEMEILCVRAAQEEEINKIKKQKCLREMERAEEEHKINIEILKEQLKKIK
ncbi:hypothetical protein RN001_006360 [Aquatica leii]|uniref:Regulatory protein zeste n=1 Tax=Aquatica leii TaxID=1421715 RepID=A0AAN7PL19_9COLE|nr:hypothetical protein RN001_006360 [Aquatica leii]